MKATCTMYLLFVLTLNLQAQQKTSMPETARFLSVGQDSQPSTTFLLTAVKPPPGFIVLRKLSSNQYIVRYRDGHLSTTPKQENLQPVNNLWKLSPELLERYPGNTGSTQEIQVLVTGSVRSDLGIWEKEGKLRMLTAHPEWSTFVISINSSRLPELLQLPTVQHVASYRKPITERELTGFDLSANKLNAAHFWYPDLAGSNQVISIKENKPDTADIDFKGRWLPSQNASAQMETHATNMATIAAGAGNTYYTGKGAAWKAGIRSADFASLMPDETSLLQAQQVIVQNHSYGVGIENFYGADAAAYDQQANEDSSLLHVFSAGNRGSETSTDGPYAGISGWANLTGSFKMSKNSLVVGAMDSLQQVVPLSSRGPAHDGRIKPELIAFGEDGSSGAAALVSGTSLLLQQLFQEKENRRAPSSLLRAILCNSADEVNSAGPDYASGYGAMNAPKAIETLQQDRYLLSGITANRAIQFPLFVPDKTALLKITLAWNDPAAIVNSVPVLANDLDIRIIDPDGNSIYPWVLDHRPTALSNNQAATTGRDSLNNLEQIQLLQPAAGSYTIEICAGSLSNAQQPFALAWQLDTATSFRITYPLGSDVLSPGRLHRIRWESTMLEPGALFYRSASLDWQLINGAIQQGVTNQHWRVPDSLTWTQFRFVFPGHEILSDTISIANETRMITGFNCTDSFLIYWAPVPRASGYRLYRLGENYMEAFTTTTDTLLIQSKQNNPFTHFSVAPLFEHNNQGRPSYAYAYQNQLTSCYIQNFLADPDGSGTARLQLELGTTYQVASIRFQRRTSSGVETIDSITVTNNRFFTITTAATEGLNLYRAIVLLSNGSTYATEWLPVYQFSSNDFFVFPSPVRKGNSFRILSKDPEDCMLVIYDITGRPLLKKQLLETTESISTSSFSSGVYIYIIFRDGVKEKTGRLIIQ